MMDFTKTFPDYTVTKEGTVFKNGIELKPFKSNKYLQVLLYDVDHKRHIFGVHTLVARIYLSDFYEGCIVHHIDGNAHNNCVENLSIMTNRQHASYHSKGNTHLSNYIKTHGATNKGTHLSSEHRRKLSEAAKRVHKTRRFLGNQYVNEDGSRKY